MEAASFGRHKPIGIPVIALLSLALGMPCVACAQDTAADHYTVVDCGPSLVRTLVDTPGLNAHGDLAIWRTQGSDTTRGVLIRSGQLVAIPGVKEYPLVYPADVNEELTVVGALQASDDLRSTQAFIWKRQQLHILPGIGGRYAEARAANSHGDVAGSAQTSQGTRHAVLWQAGTPIDLGLLDKGDYSSARDINDRGEIVGQANLTPSGRTRAVEWRNKSIHALQSLAGSSYCSAQAINNHGDITGSCDLPSGAEHGVIWKDGGVSDLGTLGDDDATSTALDINATGQVVGSSAVQDGKLRAFLWQSGKIYDLNSRIEANSGWVLLVASRINDSGVIAGRGYFRGATHAFLLRPDRR